MSIIREKSYLFKEVSRHTTDGIDAVRSGLHELCKQGYVQKIDPQRDENGIFIAGSWVVFESKKPLHD